MTTIAELKEEIDKIKLQIKTIKKNVNSKQVLEIEVKVDGFPTDLERLKMLNTIFSAKNKWQKNVN